MLRSMLIMVLIIFSSILSVQTCSGGEIPHKLQFLNREWTALFKSIDGHIYIDFMNIEKSGNYLQFSVLTIPTEELKVRLSMPHGTYAVLERILIDCKGKYAQIYEYVHDKNGRILLPPYKGSVRDMKPLRDGSALKDISEFICGCYPEPVSQVHFAGKIWRVVSVIDKPPIIAFYISDNVKREGNNLKVPVLSLVSGCSRVHYGMHPRTQMVLYEYLFDCKGRFSLNKATMYDKEGNMLEEEKLSLPGFMEIRDGSALFYVERQVCEKRP